MSYTTGRNTKHRQLSRSIVYLFLLNKARISFYCLNIHSFKVMQILSNSLAFFIPECNLFKCSMELCAFAGRGNKQKKIKYGLVMWDIKNKTANEEKHVSFRNMFMFTVLFFCSCCAWGTSGQMPSMVCLPLLFAVIWGQEESVINSGYNEVQSVSPDSHFVLITSDNSMLYKTLLKRTTKCFSLTPVADLCPQIRVSKLPSSLLIVLCKWQILWNI